VTTLGPDTAAAVARASTSRQSRIADEVSGGERSHDGNAGPAIERSITVTIIMVPMIGADEQRPGPDDCDNDHRHHHHEQQRVQVSWSAFIDRRASSGEYPGLHPMRGDGSSGSAVLGVCSTFMHSTTNLVKGRMSIWTLAVSSASM
jgi:hypothetical protein